MKLEHKVRRFELKVGGESGRKLYGHGAAFLNIDSTGDIIAPGAFKADLPDFLAAGFVGGLNHNWDQPIAAIEVASEDEKGLYFESSDIIETSHGSDVLKMVSGPKPVVRKLSIGYKPLSKMFLETPEDCKAFWESHQYTPSQSDLDRSQSGVRLLTRVKLFEVSPVSVPANDLASIVGIKDGLQGGRRFADHSDAVRAAVLEFRDRASALAGLRQKEGRVLSAASRARLRQLLDGLKSAVTDLDRILVETEPEKAGVRDRNAVPEVPPAEVPGIDWDAIRHQYITTLGRLADLDG